MRFGIWRFTLAPSDVTEKNSNTDAQLYSSCTQKPQRYLAKFTSCITFGAHKLVRSQPFLDYLYKV